MIFVALIALLFSACSVESAPKAKPITQAIAELGIVGHWAGQCIQFGATDQATQKQMCIPYKSKSGPISYFYSVDYDANGTAALVNSPGGPLMVPGSQGKPPWYAVYVPSDTYGKIVKMTMIPSPSNQKVACIQLQQTDGTIAAYVANITKTTDPATGLMTYTYIENGIVSQATNSYQSTCAGYKPTLWCTAKTYNYQCTMVFAVRT